MKSVRRIGEEKAIEMMENRNDGGFCLSIEEVFRPMFGISNN